MSTDSLAVNVPESEWEFMKPISEDECFSEDEAPEQPLSPLLAEQEARLRDAGHTPHPAVATARPPPVVHAAPVAVPSTRRKRPRAITTDNTAVRTTLRPPRPSAAVKLEECTPFMVYAHTTVVQRSNCTTHYVEPLDRWGTPTDRAILWNVYRTRYRAGWATVVAETLAECNYRGREPPLTLRVGHAKRLIHALCLRLAALCGPLEVPVRTEQTQLKPLFDEAE